MKTLYAKKITDCTNEIVDSAGKVVILPATTNLVLA